MLCRNPEGQACCSAGEVSCLEISIGASEESEFETSTDYRSAIASHRVRATESLYLAVFRLLLALS